MVAYLHRGPARQSGQTMALLTMIYFPTEAERMMVMPACLCLVELYLHRQNIYLE